MDRLRCHLTTGPNPWHDRLLLQWRLPFRLAPLKGQKAFLESVTYYA